MACLRSDLNNNVLVLTIDRPKANAFNLELIGELQTAFKKAAKDSQVRSVVLTGAGQVFGAGQDIEELNNLANQAGGEHLSFREHLLNTYNPLILQIRQIEKPVIAAVNGTCAGASLGIALACDLRFAAEPARFVVGFCGIGLAPDSGVSLLLPALIGLGRSLEFTFSNQPISAQKALEWGLVNRVVPFADLQQEALTAALELSKGPVATFGLAKRVYNKAILPGLAKALDYESYIQEIAGQGQEHREGLAAFLEKRPARHL
jgi:2-(1,2-epoxy-1,2-dihydrophenyl)acetyl-CoA isomerase